MKHMKKLAAVLLAAVMAMTLLTACGGGGGGGASNGFVDASDAFTKAINSELTSIGSDVQLTYDKDLSQKTATFLTAYSNQLKGITGTPTKEQLAAAEQAGFQAAGLDSEKYYLVSYFADSPDTYGVTDAAKKIAPVVKEQASAGKKATTIGYVTLTNEAYRPIGLFMILGCE